MWIHWEVKCSGHKCVCVCARVRVCVCTLSCVRLFATPFTVAHQAPLSTEFSRQEYWNGFPFPSPGDLLHPGIKCVSCVSCTGRWILYHWTTCEAWQFWHFCKSVFGKNEGLVMGGPPEPWNEIWRGNLMAKSLPWNLTHHQTIWVKGEPVWRPALGPRDGTVALILQLQLCVLGISLFP